MDKVEKVSIGGYAFTLETAACAAAQAYLDELTRYYKDRDGGAEVMEGIEDRFAELLLERTGTAGVATLADIQAVKDILGRPDQLEDEPETPSGEKPRRRLFRDLENKVLGGVCSGLAAYFNIDVAPIRIIWTVLALVALGGFASWSWGSSTLIFVVAYVIMWICVPPAKTVQQRWQMRGESGTVDEISRTVSSGIREIGEAAGRLGNSQPAHRLGRAFLVCIGIILLLGGTALLTVTGLSVFTDNVFGLRDVMTDSILDGDVPQAFSSLLTTRWIWWPGLLAVALPGIGLLYGGLQMIFGFRSPKWRPGLVIFILWLVTLVVLAVAACSLVFSAGYSWM